MGRAVRPECEQLACLGKAVQETDAYTVETNMENMGNLVKTTAAIAQHSPTHHALHLCTRKQN